MHLPTILPSDQSEAISEYVFITKYARYDQKKKRRETWDEAVDRVRDMHLQRYGSKGIESDIRWAFEQVRDKKVLPSMRSMQFGGEAILANDARMYNCAYTFADRQRFFSEALWMLLSGVGVGFSVQKHHVANLPELIKHQSPDEKEVMTYTVADTIEGWADALDVLMSTYFVNTPISGREVFFDFSKIRRKGSWLKTSGGRAPGAGPLRLALKRIKKVLREAAANGFKKLKTIHVYDIIMMFADAVLSGGIRRSATIALFSPDDEDMMTAKSFRSSAKVLSHKRKDDTWLIDFGEGTAVAWNLKCRDSNDEPQKGEEVDVSWSNIMPWRARSNNSVALVRDKCTKQQFKAIIENAKKYGEPGFVLLDNTEYGYNPCVEIGLNPVDPLTGETGWQVCNLCEINGSKIKTKADFKSAVKAATIIGTLQAGYTYFHYLTNTSRRIIERERLLGVSVTGWMENPEFLLDPKVQREMALYAVETNQIYAEHIGIDPAARVTCTKPAGSSALVLGTCSGIHPYHSHNFFRRVQANSLEQPLQFFKIWNPQAVERSMWGANDEVITFCVQIPDHAVVSSDLSAIEFLKKVKSTYLNWVVPGTARPNSSPGLTHNVSNTVTVAADEWDDVADFIYDNRQHFSGIALLPKLGDKIFKQATFERVESEADVERWNELVAQYSKMDWTLLKEASDHTSLRETVACAGGACEV
jgi:ribonucleoside-diphosphate reductase alpha chain